LRYLFEDCVLEMDCRELRRGTNLVAIEPQVFDLLVYLIRHRDRVVSKDELLASVWHGRAISESALFNRINAARSAIGDTGQRQGLIKTLPRRGLRFVGAVQEEKFGPAVPRPDKPSPVIADKPSIAVLPFINLSGDPEQDYFIDGIVEDVITALSRNRAFFVIARNSSFTYKGKPVDTKQVARELGVRYILEGSVRKSRNRVRLTGQFIDAESGYHLWADRFEGDLLDIFDLQDQLVTSVVGAIAPQLEKAEIERAKRELTNNPAAYDFYLRGLASWNYWSRADNAKALKLFYAAIEKDPEFATPYGLAASCYQFAKANGWQSDFDAEEISRLTERAVELGNDDAVALCWAGHVRAFFFKEVDRALLLINRALELDLNLAVAWQRSGWVRGYAGDSDGAIESLNKAMRLDPLDTRVFLTQSAMAFAHFVAGRDQEAAEWAALALRTKPNWMPALRVAIASNAMHGGATEAKAALRSYEQIDPNVSIRKICEHYPFQRQKDRQRLVKALRRAGVREA
jgi:TolB-like protein